MTMSKRAGPLAVLAVLAGAIACAPRPKPATDPTASAGSAGPATSPASGPPVVREVVVRGAELFSRERVLAIVRTRPGQALYRDAATAARFLEARYRTAGYPGATVRGTFDEATGTLALDVDEGTLGEVVVRGVDDDVAERVRKTVALPAGEPVKDRDIRKGLQRLEDSSAGALERGNPPYAVEPGPGGARVVLDVVRRRHRVAVIPFGSGSAPVWNRVEGFAPWAGVELTRYDPAGFNHAFAWARAGYGFSSDEPRWAVGALKPFGPDRLFTVGYEFHDLTDSDDLFRRVGFESSPAVVVAVPRAGDYFERQGHEAFLFVRPDPRVQLGASFRADTYASMATQHGDHENPPIAPGEMRSVVLTARAATSDLWPALRRERNALLGRSLYGTRREAHQTLRVDGTLELADPSLGGDFEFQRLLLDTRAVHRLTPALEVRGRGLLGLSWGTVPPQRQLALGGVGTLPARSSKELPGRHVGLLQAEVVSDLPLGRFAPSLVGFYDGGLAWTPDQAGHGWRSDLGLGVEWPVGDWLARVDAAWALDPLDGQKRFRVSARGRLQF